MRVDYIGDSCFWWVGHHKDRWERKNRSSPAPASAVSGRPLQVSGEGWQITWEGREAAEVTYQYDDKGDKQTAVINSLLVSSLSPPCYLVYLNFYA